MEEQEARDLNPKAPSRPPMPQMRGGLASLLGVTNFLFGANGSIRQRRLVLPRRGADWADVGLVPVRRMEHRSVGHNGY
jgi:hypothetical protein